MKKYDESQIWLKRYKDSGGVVNANDFSKDINHSKGRKNHYPEINLTKHLFFNSSEPSIFVINGHISYK